MTPRACVAALAGGVLVVACDGEIELGQPASRPTTDAAASADGASDGGSIPAAPLGSCVVDADCGVPSLHCDVARGACVECLNDTQCASTDRRRCDASLFRCVGCRVDADCEPGKRCESATRRCVDRCSPTQACSVGTCDIERGSCLECVPGSSCVDRRVCSTSSVCVACTSDADCAAGGEERFCDRVIAQCVECTSLAHCASGLRCDPASGECASSTHE